MHKLISAFAAGIMLLTAWPTLAAADSTRPFVLTDLRGGSRAGVDVTFGSVDFGVADPPLVDYLSDMRDAFRASRPSRSILVGDLNIAPREDDVWDHKKLLRVVSHTPVEVAALADVQESGGWVDVTRQDIPDGRLYTWWSYRARDWAAADKGRRLDHIWASADLGAAAHSSQIVREARGWDQPSDHVPVTAAFDV